MDDLKEFKLAISLIVFIAIALNSIIAYTLMSVWNFIFFFFPKITFIESSIVSLPILLAIYFYKYL